MVIILAFIVTGVAMMILHHELYHFLNGKAVNQNFGRHGQAIASALGTFIAYIAHQVLAAAMGIVFVQLLWDKLHSRPHTVKHIDALIACGNSPWTPSAFQAWKRSTIFLAFIAALASVLAAITIFAPGSLSVQANEYQLPAPCTVRAPNLGGGNLASASTQFGNPIAHTMSVTTRIVVQGSYLPPVSMCESACQFDIQYFAPVLNCTDITTSADLNTLLPEFTFWNSSFTFDGPLVIDVAMNTSTTTQQAVQCVAYNGTYTATIQQTLGFSTIAVADILLNNQITSNLSAEGEYGLGIDALADALARAVNGTVASGASYGFTPDSNAIANTWITSDAYTEEIKVDLMEIMPSFMQNVSLSITSGYYDYPGYYSTIPEYYTTCWYPTSVFSYDERHLIPPYVGGIGLTIICAILAVMARARNGRDESLGFPRILEAVLGGPSSTLSEGKLTGESQLKLDSNGQFLVVPGEALYDFQLNNESVSR
jgi:hypothetical protein